MQENPLQPSGLFSTPESVEALQAYIATMSPKERHAATLAMMMTWNLCSKLVQESINERYKQSPF